MANYRKIKISGESTSVRQTRTDVSSGLIAIGEGVQQFGKGVGSLVNKLEIEQTKQQTLSYENEINDAITTFKLETENIWDESKLNLAVTDFLSGREDKLNTDIENGRFNSDAKKLVLEKYLPSMKTAINDVGGMRYKAIAADALVGFETNLQTLTNIGDIDKIALHTKSAVDNNLISPSQGVKFYQDSMQTITYNDVMSDIQYGKVVNEETGATQPYTIEELSNIGIDIQNRSEDSKYKWMSQGQTTSALNMIYNRQKVQIENYRLEDKTSSSELTAGALTESTILKRYEGNPEKIKFWNDKLSVYTTKKFKSAQYSGTKSTREGVEKILKLRDKLYKKDGVSSQKVAIAIGKIMDTDGVTYENKQLIVNDIYDSLASGESKDGLIAGTKLIISPKYKQFNTAFDSAFGEAFGDLHQYTRGSEYTDWYMKANNDFYNYWDETFKNTYGDMVPFDKLTPVEAKDYMVNTYFKTAIVDSKIRKSSAVALKSFGMKADITPTVVETPTAVEENDFLESLIFEKTDKGL